MIEKLGVSALHLLDPERAHDLSLRLLRLGLLPLPGPVSSLRLQTEIAGLSLPNPVGLAAGYDKNAVATAALMRAGFGFLEVGAATPKPQPGNPRPRLFRLTQDRAVINRFGFNNDGVAAIAERLAALERRIPVGLNLGANKNSEDRAGDYARVFAAAAAHLDFATVNVSSPNTEKLRDLQGPDALRALLAGVMAARDESPRHVPVFLKIAPDLDRAALSDIAGIAAEAGVDAIIATNTTLERKGLNSPHRDEAGGLSGAPLFERSTRVLAELSAQCDIPLIGVGGISSAEEAWIKITAGASAVQLYSAMVYQGLSLIPRIASGLEELAVSQGYANVAAARGSRRGDWL